MGKRKLYPNLSTKKIQDKDTIQTMNFLSFCDGKTSLLNVISGRYKPKEGKLFYKGTDITLSLIHI